MISCETSDQVVVVDAMMWKPRPGAGPSTEAELAAARATLRAIHDLAGWSPWVAEDRAAELDAAIAVMGRWQRAEPDHPAMSAEQLKADLDRQIADDAETAQFAAQQQQVLFASRRADFDPSVTACDHSPELLAVPRCLVMCCAGVRWAVLRRARSAGYDRRRSR
ncbi:hypothetical protein AB0J82_20795 [Asanoa sp. NPDC049518]|uniref:hypothetical protein n=1 Tax=unclassified Asanoa TaxID=2685164 RepID=UPI00343873A6